jgi:hypothetical protein
MIYRIFSDGELQFKIIKEIKLFDLGNIDNIIKIFKILDKNNI